MEIKLLGTGAAEGMPALFCQCDFCRRAARLGGRNIRARSNALVNGHILLDFSPDMHSNQIRYGLDFGEVTDLFVTHPHIDHIAAAELALRSAQYGEAHPRERLRVHCSRECEAMIRGILHYDAGSDPDDFLEFHPLVPFLGVEAGEVTVTPLPCRHASEGFPCFVFLLEEGERRFLYCTDAAELPEETWDFLAGKYLDAAVLDCTFGLRPVERTGTHMNLRLTEETWERLRSIGCADSRSRCWLTHFSHKCGSVHAELAQAASSLGFHAAWDGVEIRV